MTYPIPEPLDTLEECQRFNNLDLPNMDRTELSIERYRLLSAIAEDDGRTIILTSIIPPVKFRDWAIDRVRRVEALCRRS